MMSVTTVLRGLVTVAAVVSIARPAVLEAQSVPSGGNATIYMGTYAKSIYVVDEATMRVTDTIAVQNDIPISLLLSDNRERFYVRDASFEHVEVVDIAQRRSVDTFSLSSGNTKVRIWGLSVEPHERYAILLVNAYTKLADRFEIGPPTLLRYDLASKQVTDTIPWPDGEERDRVRIMFSPDGDLAYFFADDILVLETENFTQVDKWELSQPLEEGMGRFSFGFPTTLYEEPGFYTGLFRITDPVQNRRLMGVARVDLGKKDVNFYVLGPSESVGFSIAPDRKKAYGLHQETGNYQFWTFDLEGKRVEKKVQFDGRPRMGLIPSSNGRLLYIYNAGNTIDIYDAVTFQHLKRVELDADMTAFVLLPPRTSSGGS
jgi:DNA-binding beta-propeller fold protein YncE